jgi:signal transduction histidine kinase/HAMP domain-containing protein
MFARVGTSLRTVLRRASLTLTQRVVLYLTIIALIPLATLGFLSYQLSRAAMHERVTRDTQALMTEKLSYLQLLMHDVEGLLTSVASLDDIKQVLVQHPSFARAKGDYERLATQAKIGYILSGYASLSGILSIDLFSMAEAHYHVGETLNAQEIRKDLLAQLFRHAAASSQSIVWTGIEDNVNLNSRYPKVITVLKVIRSLNVTTAQEEPVGLLLVSYDPDTFYQKFQREGPEKQTFRILDAAYRIVYDSDPRKIATTAPPPPPSPASESGFYRATVEGADTIVMHNRDPLSKWTLLSFILVARIEAPVVAIGRNTLLALGLSLGLAITFIVYMSRKVVMPITTITRHFIAIQDGRADLEMRLPVTSQDEIGRLAQWFNVFIESLMEKRRSEEALLESREQLRRSHEVLERRVEERTGDLRQANEALRTEIAERKRSEEAARRHALQLETIRAVSVEITRELDLGALLHLITDRVVELIGGGQCMIRLWDEVGQLLVPRAYTGSLVHWTDRRLRLGEGVVGTAAQRRQGMVVNDFRSSPYAIPLFLEGTTYTAVLAEPLLFGDRLVGVLSIDREADQRPFTEEDQRLVGLLAVQAAIAIENARLHEATVRRGEQLKALLSSLQTVTSGLDLREILDRILGEAVRISGTPHVKVLLLDKTSRALRVGAIRGSGMPPADALPAGASLSGLVVQSGEPVFIADAPNDPRNLWRERDRELGIVTYLGLPIKKGEEVLGVLTFNNTFPHQYTPEEMTLLTSFAAQAAIAIENARLHEEVTRHATTLEARVQERTTELARMNIELTAALRQAEAGNQAKNDFLINMSHELRTPLNSVLGFAYLLQEQLASQLNPKQARFLANISNSGQHLLAIVNEILDLDTAEVGRLTLHLTKVNLAEVITEALDATREAVRRKGHSVHALIPPDIPVFNADRDRIRQIAICLLSNAVKFTPDGGRITVAARRISNFQFLISNLENIGPNPQSQIANQKSKIGDFLEIAVADTGIGIRAEDLPRLFRMFSQLEPPLTKRYEGTGVGLALAKRLVELHGGTITAASPGVNQGSTFTVRLPVEQGE